MIPFYEETSDHLQLIEQTSFHCPPHLHKSIEMIYVTKGSIVIGTGIDLFEMQEGDFAVVFPNLIHHYQVFQPGQSRHITLLASPSYFGNYENILQNFRPDDPVIPKEKVHPDIPYALRSLLGINPLKHQDPGNFGHDWGEEEAEIKTEDGGKESGMKVTRQSGQKRKKTGHHRHQKQEMSEEESRMVYALDHGYLQVILGRAIPDLTLSPRVDIKDQDIVYQTVAYVSAKYQDDITLSKMAEDLGLSPFALSRVFSGIFHQNFNRYVNDVRLQHVTVQLAETDKPITEIAYDCGFQSQATFNRVFQAKYHMTPREYRNHGTPSP